MNDESMFLQIFVVIYIVFAAIRVYYRTKPSVRERPEQGRREGLDVVGGRAGVAIIFSILGYFASIALYLISPPWMQWSRLALPTWIRWTGVFFGIACLPPLVWIHRTMGRFYLDRLELKDDHRLITSGPFSRIRNPMYVVFCNFAFAMSLVTSYLLNFVFTFLITISLNWIVSSEEEMMLERFGDEYREYMRRTGRFLPRLNRDPNAE